MNREALQAIEAGIEKLIAGVRALQAVAEPAPQPAPIPTPDPTPVPTPDPTPDPTPGPPVPAPVPDPTPAPVGGDQLPAWLAAPPARQWFRGGNGLKAIDPRYDPRMNPLFDATGLTRPPWGMSNWNIEGIFAWSGAAKHPTLPQLARFGGGHGDSAYNGIPLLTLADDGPIWAHLQWGDGTVGHWDGLDKLGFDARDGSHDDYAFSGNPRSAHTYNGVAWVGDTIYCTQGYKAGLGGINGRTLWGYNVPARAWAAVSTLPHNGFTFRDFCHVPTIGGATGALVGVGPGNSELARFDISAGTWSGSQSYTNTSGGARMVYVPAPWDCVVGLNYMVGNGFFVHDFGRTPLVSGNEHRPAAVGPRPFTEVGDDLKSGVWVAALGCVVGWKWGADLWTLTPPASGDPRDAWTWGELTAAAGNTVTPMGRPGSQDPEIFGGFFHHEFGDVVVFCLSILDAAGNDEIRPYFFKVQA